MTVIPLRPVIPPQTSLGVPLTTRTPETTLGVQLPRLIRMVDFLHVRPAIPPETTLGVQPTTSSGWLRFSQVSKIPPETTLNVPLHTSVQYYQRS